MLINQNQNRISFGSKAGRELLKSGYQNFQTLDNLSDECCKIGETPIDIKIDAAIIKLPAILEKFSSNLPDGKFDEFDALIFSMMKKTFNLFKETILNYSYFKEETSALHKKLDPIQMTIGNIENKHGGFDGLINPKECTEGEDILILQRLRNF